MGYPQKIVSPFDTMWVVTIEDWIEGTAKWLQNTHGLAESFAPKVARFLAYCYQYKLSPRIIVGFRSPEHQEAMQRAWDRGERTGLRVRPATNSKHSVRDDSGRGASHAIDIVTSNDSQAAAIARYLGIGAGQDFTHPDPGHYFLA